MEYINDQERAINLGESAKKAKEELVGFRAKAAKAASEYTQKKYTELNKSWELQNKQLEELLLNVHCQVHNWKSIIECYVCPLVTELYLTELDLHEDPIDYCECLSDVAEQETCADYDHKCEEYAEWRNETGASTQLSWQDVSLNHYSLRHWLERDLWKKEQRFQRIKDILTAWENPAKLIESVLAENAKAIKELRERFCVEKNQVVFDLFMKVLPLHSAIGPRDLGLNKRPSDCSQHSPIDEILAAFDSFCCCSESSKKGSQSSTSQQSAQSKKESECKCSCMHKCKYKSKCDECEGCEYVLGINMNTPTILERVVGVYPSLVEPDMIFETICDFATNYYVKRQQEASDAKAKYDAKLAEISRLEDRFKNGVKDFYKNAKLLIPESVESCGVHLQKPSQQQSHLPCEEETTEETLD